MAATNQGPTMAGPIAESTETVVGRHLQAFMVSDLETIMADFADDALLCTSDGPLRGRGAIRAFFEQVLPAFPPGATTLDVKQQIVDKELFYIVWSASSPTIDVPLACDVFIVRDGKLIYQCFAGQVLPKSRST